MNARWTWARDEAGSASVVVLGAAFGVLALVTALAGSVRLQADLIRAATAADAAAVGAAAAAVGIVPGEPCVAASRVVAMYDARLHRCDVHGSDVSVRAVTHSGMFPVGATSHAGPERASAIYKGGHRWGSARARCVYGVPVGPPLAGFHGRSERTLRAAADLHIDQGVTCQARRSL